MRKYWSRYLQCHIFLEFLLIFSVRYVKNEVEAMVFVVDSSKSEKEVAEALIECKTFVEEHAKRWWPVLILANKQDVTGALSVTQVRPSLTSV